MSGSLGWPPSSCTRNNYITYHVDMVSAKVNRVLQMNKERIRGDVATWELDR